MAASVTHCHLFISALGKLVNLISTEADNGELVAEMFHHQQQQITKVQSNTARRRGGMRFVSRMQKDLSLKLIAVIATFPKFSKLFSLFSSLILTVSCEGLQLYMSVKVLVLFLC